jgi:uncharacterized membrane protein
MTGFILALAVHLIAATIWVGGMFFAHVVLRPSVMDMAPPDRLALWRKVLPRFFTWVWASIAAILATGYGVLLLGYRGGLGGGGLHIDIMQVTGLIMTANFVFLYFGPFGSFKRLLEEGDIKGAAAAQNRIRQIVVVNLVLGLLTMAVGGTGTLWAY